MYASSRLFINSITINGKNLVTGYLFAALLASPMPSFGANLCAGNFSSQKNEVYLSSATEYSRIASKVLANLGAQMGIEVRIQNYFCDDSRKWFMSYPREGEAINRFSDTEFTKEFKILTSTMKLLGELLGDNNGHNSHQGHVESGKPFIYSIMSEFELEKFLQPATRESIGGMLEPNQRLYWQEISQLIDKLEHEKVINSYLNAGGTQDNATELWKRIHLLRLALTQDHEKAILSSADLIKRVNISKSKIVHNRNIIKTLKKKTMDRFLADFKANTNFESFEEYKRIVLEIPEYREFIQSFFKEYGLEWNASQTKLIGVIANGIKSMDQVGFSSFEGNSYKTIRRTVEAENVGMELKDYLTEIPPQYRPVSTFVVNDSTFQSGSARYSIYGDTYFKISMSKLFAAIEQGDLFLTFSLGDSIRNSEKWFGRTVPFEIFPFLAAPFVVQYHSIGGSGLGVIDYVKDVYGVTDQAPKFTNDLHKMMKIPIRTEGAFKDNAGGISSDYVEAQVYGIMPIDMVESIQTTHAERLNPQVREALKLLEIDLWTY